MKTAPPDGGKNSEHEVTICSFWFGPLSWLERVSIASFIANGHHFDLYSYEQPEALPFGCRWIDAATVVPRDQMFFYKGNRSPAVFADYFRLMLMQRDAGIWVDCDMLCIAPFGSLPDHIFGYEVAPGDGAHGGQINNAVLRLPPNSPLLGRLLTLFEDDGQDRDPVWLPTYRRWEVNIRRWLGQRIGLSHMQFGATGPFPLTFYAKELCLDHLAQDKNVFYPLAYKKAAELIKAGSSLKEYMTSDTLGVHLWRMALTDRSRASVPVHPEKGSALSDLCHSLGIDPDR